MEWAEVSPGSEKLNFKRAESAWTGRGPGVVTLAQDCPLGPQVPEVLVIMGLVLWATCGKEPRDRGFKSTELGGGARVEMREPAKQALVQSGWKQA